MVCLVDKQRLRPRDHPRLRRHSLAQELWHGNHPPVREVPDFAGLEPIELVHAQSCLMQYAAECADSNLAVSWHNCGASASIGRSSELDMASSLADLCEARRPQSARDFAIWQRSKRHRLRPRWCEPVGSKVAVGASKWSASASRKFAKASSSDSPWLATSTSKACATYHSPSCQTLAENSRIMLNSLHLVLDAV